MLYIECCKNTVFILNYNNIWSKKLYSDVKLFYKAVIKPFKLFEK